MKKLTWFAGAAGALIFTQTIQAVPVRPNLTRTPVDTAAVISVKAVAVAALETSKLAVTAKTSTGLLSSVIPRQGLSPNANRDYSPSRIIRDPNPSPAPTSPVLTPNDPPALVADSGSTLCLLGLALLTTAAVKRITAA